MTRSPPALAAALVAAALLVGCSASAEPAAAPTTPAAAESAPAPTAPAPQPVTDPLTGTMPAPVSPLVAVKIDNGPLARPFHRGLEGAAVVYQELVEGGTTRLLALYSQPFDQEIGPIRSFRDSDIELLVQYGRPAVGFSGAHDILLGAFRDAVRVGQLADASYDTHPGLYRLAEKRRDAQNFFAVPTQLGQTAEGATPARDTGLTFDPATRPDAVPATSARVAFSDRESVELRYDPATTRYTVVQAGVPVGGAAPANVVVQQVSVADTGIVDATGAVTPYSSTVGGGTVDVLRNGGRVTGRWERPTLESGTRLVDAAGADIPLAPGPTWVMLQPAGQPFSAG